MNLYISFISYTKINSKLDHALNIKLKKFTNTHTHKSLRSRPRQRIFKLDPKRQFIKEKIDKFDLINIKNICSVKDPVKWVKRQATD